MSAVAHAVAEVADRGGPTEIASSAEALRRVAVQLDGLLTRLQPVRLTARPRQAQRQMAEQPVLAVVQVHAGDLLDPAQPVVQPAAVQRQRRRGALDVARVIQVRLERPHERLVAGQQPAQPFG